MQLAWEDDEEPQKPVQQQIPQKKPVYSNNNSKQNFPSNPPIQAPPNNPYAKEIPSYIKNNPLIVTKPTQ